MDIILQTTCSYTFSTITMLGLPYQLCFVLQQFEARETCSQYIYIYYWHDTDLNSLSSLQGSSHGVCGQIDTSYESVKGCWYNRHWPLRDVVVIWSQIFEHVLRIDFTSFSRNCSQVKAAEYLWWRVFITSGNGLVPLYNKPSSQPILTQIYVTIWLQSGTDRHNSSIAISTIMGFSNERSQGTLYDYVYLDPLP